MRNSSSLRYTTFRVKEATTLLEFIQKALDGVSHNRAKAILTGGLVMGVAFSAMAHPELKSSVPQADSAVAAPEKIQLNFSENLTVKFSGAKLTMTGMKGMSSHSPMPVAAKVAPGADPKSMVIIPREPLPAGTYRVDWRAVSSDTHPITGNYTFTVK